MEGGNQLAIYKRGRGFELGTTKNNSKRQERDLNPGPPDVRVRRAHHSSTLPPFFAFVSIMSTGKEQERSLKFVIEKILHLFARSKFPAKFLLIPRKKCT